MRDSLLFAVLLFLLLVLSACGGGGTTITSQPSLPGIEPTESLGGSLPDVLPQDGVNSWETLNTGGFIVPRQGSPSGEGRTASGINDASEFYYGDQTYSFGGGALPSGSVLQLDGSAMTSWAIYRLPLGGPQPGVVSVDANLLEADGGGTSEYYVGLSDYGAGGWDWHGPFSDNHVRLGAKPGAELVSPLGSLYVSVVASDGNRINVVGVGASPRDAGDSTAPPQVTGLNVQAHVGALELNWNNVAAADLAGYQVYFDDAAFIDGKTLGVQRVPYLMGSATSLLKGDGTLFVRVAAVDISGNVGPVSEIQSQLVTAGSVPDLLVTIDSNGAQLNDPVSATATGAGSYDWDLDGDGLFDIIGDLTGVQTVYTGASGIIRPGVRGHSGGIAVAQGGVSLVVSGNSRPVAAAFATPQSGVAPLEVTFSGEAEDTDGTLANFAWDFDGDSVYDYEDASNMNPPPHTFNTPGTYNAKFRVWDDDGAWDSDTVAITVQSAGAPYAALSVSTDRFYLDALSGFSVDFDASASFNAQGGALTFEFDPLGLGNWADNGSSPNFNYVYEPEENGLHQAAVRVTNALGLSSVAVVPVAAYRFIPTTVHSRSAVGRISLFLLGSRPAMCWPDYFSSTQRGACLQVFNDDAGTELGAGLYHDTTVPAIGPSAAACASDDGRYINLAWYDDTSDYLEVGYRDLLGGGSGWAQRFNIADKGSAVTIHPVDGKPAIFFRDLPTNSMVFQRSNSAIAFSDWGTENVVSVGNSSSQLDLAIINGIPAVVFQDSTSQTVRYSIADDVSGSNWSTPVIIEPASGDNMGYGCQLTQVNGNPAVLFRNSTDGTAHFVRSNTADGLLAADWGAPVIIDLPDDFDVSGYLALAVVSGRPDIAVVGTKSAERSRIYLYRGTNSNGAAFGTPLLVDLSPGYTFQHIDMKEVAGLPAIAVSVNYTGVSLLTPQL